MFFFFKRKKKGRKTLDKAAVERFTTLYYRMAFKTANGNNNKKKEEEEEEEEEELDRFLNDLKTKKEGMTNSNCDASSNELDDVQMRLFVTYCMAFDGNYVANNVLLKDILFKGANVTCDNSQRVFLSLLTKTKAFRSDNRHGKTHMKIYDAFVNLFFKLVCMQSCTSNLRGSLIKMLNDCLLKTNKTAIMFNESNVSFRPYDSFDDIYSSNGGNSCILCETNNKSCLKCQFTGDIKNRIPDLILVYRTLFYDFLIDCYAYFSKMMVYNDTDGGGDTDVGRVRKGEKTDTIGIFHTLGMTDVVRTCLEYQTIHPIFNDALNTFEFIKNTFKNKKKLLSIGYFTNNDAWSCYFSSTLNFLFADLMLLDLNNCNTISYETDERHYKHTASVCSPNSVSCNCRLFSKIPKNYQALVRTDHRHYSGGDITSNYGRTRVNYWGNEDNSYSSTMSPYNNVVLNDRSNAYGVFVNATHESNQTYAFTSVFFLSAKKYDETEVGSFIRFETALSVILDRYRNFHLRCKKEFVVNIHRHQQGGATKSQSIFLKMLLLLIFATIVTYMLY